MGNCATTGKRPAVPREDHFQPPGGGQIKACRKTQSGRRRRPRTPPQELSRSSASPTGEQGGRGGPASRKEERREEPPNHGRAAGDGRAWPSGKRQRCPRTRSACVPARGPRARSRSPWALAVAARIPLGTELRVVRSGAWVTMPPSSPAGLVPTARRVLRAHAWARAPVWRAPSCVLVLKITMATTSAGLKGSHSPAACNVKT